MVYFARCLSAGLAICWSLLGFVSASSPLNHQHVSYHSPSHLSTWEQIHQVLSAYALAIDYKDFNALSYVFAEDATANYTGPLSNLQGLNGIRQGLDASVARIDTQHLLGTILIDLSQVKQSYTGARKGSLANSTTYFQASLFGKGSLQGEVLYMYGNYQDELIRTSEGWRIRKRQLVFQGPFIGNMEIIQP